LAPSLLLPHGQRLLDRKLVVGVEDPGDAGRVEALSVGGHLHAGLGIRDLLDADDLEHAGTSRSRGGAKRDCSNFHKVGPARAPPKWAAGTAIRAVSPGPRRAVKPGPCNLHRWGFLRRRCAGLGVRISFA